MITNKEVLLAPQTITVSITGSPRDEEVITGTGVDIMDYDGAATIVLTSSEADTLIGGMLVSVYHSDSPSSGYTSLFNFNSVGGNETDNYSVQMRDINTNFTKRYIRAEAYAVIVGSPLRTTNFKGVSVILYGKKQNQ